MSTQREAREARAREADLWEAAEQKGWRLFRTKGPILSRRYELRIFNAPGRAELFVNCASLDDVERAINAETLGQALGLRT